MVPSEEPEPVTPELEIPDSDTPFVAPGAAAVAGNQPPVIRAMQVDPAPTIPGGTDVVVVVDALDPEGDEVELEYLWFVNEAELEHEGSRLSTHELSRGDTVRVEVVASDGRSESAAMRSPLLTVQNTPLRILSQPTPPGPDGVFRYKLEVEDSEDVAQLRFSLAQAPEGMRVSPVRGLVEWTPRSDQTGVHPVEIVVQDASGTAARQSFELSIGSPPAAGAP